MNTICSDSDPYSDLSSDPADYRLARDTVLRKEPDDEDEDDDEDDERDKEDDEDEDGVNNRNDGYSE